MSTVAESLESKLGPGSYYGLAKDIGRDRSYVMRILRGRVEGTPKVLFDIADAAGVSMDELRAWIESQR